MAHHRSHTGSTFDPTLALATDRIRERHQEAHVGRLAAMVPSTPSSVRVRLGHALIALGSTLASSVDHRQPSLTD